MNAMKEQQITKVPISRKIYLASSWRNKYQPEMVESLRNVGHEVYDFRNPGPNLSGFKWSQIDEQWEQWDLEAYRTKLTTSPMAVSGFNLDYGAMEWADTCVLLLPCGRSAHLEAGYFRGARKNLFIYIPESIEPDLMYLMANKICLNKSELFLALQQRWF